MGFVKSYIQLFAYSSVTTEDWKKFLFSYFKDQVRTIRLGDVQLGDVQQLLLTEWPLALRWTS